MEDIYDKKKEFLLREYNHILIHNSCRRCFNRSLAINYVPQLDVCLDKIRDFIETHRRECGCSGMGKVVVIYNKLMKIKNAVEVNRRLSIIEAQLADQVIKLKDPPLIEAHIKPRIEPCMGPFIDPRIEPVVAEAEVGGGIEDDFKAENEIGIETGPIIDHNEIQKIRVDKTLTWEEKFQLLETLVRSK